MRNLLAFLALAALTFAGLGWYLDWYKIQSTPTSAGRHSIQIDINSKKITEDVHKGVQQGEEKLQQALDKEGRQDNGTAGETKKNEPSRSGSSAHSPITNLEEEFRPHSGPAPKGGW